MVRSASSGVHAREFGHCRSSATHGEENHDHAIDHRHCSAGFETDDHCSSKTNPAVADVVADAENGEAADPALHLRLQAQVVQRYVGIDLVHVLDY